MTIRGEVQILGTQPPETRSALVEAEWQYRLDSAQLVLDESELFRFFRKTSKSTYEARLGLAPRYALNVERYFPTPGFVKRLSRSTSFAQMGKNDRFPLTNVSIGIFSASIKSLVVEVFSEDSLLIRIRAEFSASLRKEGLAGLYESLKAVRSASSLPAVEDLFRTAKELLVRPAKRDVRPLRNFAFFIRLPLIDSEYRKQMLVSRRALSSFHVGAERQHELDMSLVEELENSCAKLNLKSMREVMIANAQGVTYIVPSDDHLTPYPGRFDKAVDLLAVATYFRGVMLDRDDKRATAPQEWQKILNLTKRWIRYPNNVLHTSVSNIVLWNVFISSFYLDSFLEELLVVDDSES